MAHLRRVPARLGRNPLSGIWVPSLARALDLDARQVGRNPAAFAINVLGRYRAAIQLAGQGNE